MNSPARKTIAIVAAAILSLASLVAKAQEAPYKFDMGAAVGMSGYLGDVNQSNMFRHPGLAAALQFRYIMDVRWSLRVQAGFTTLSGNSEDFSNVFPDGAVYSFKSSVADLGARVEFNFFPYGVGETYKRLRRWTPYVAVGLGGSFAKAEDVDGSSITFNIPLGIGFKFKLKERLNAHVEFTMTKAFGDRIDGDLDDLYQIKSSFLKNTDWYSGITVGLSYEFGKRCEACNRID